jgi:hypothetical protein
MAKCTNYLSSLVTELTDICTRTGHLVVSVQIPVSSISLLVIKLEREFVHLQMTTCIIVQAQVYKSGVPTANGVTWCEHLYVL